MEGWTKMITSTRRYGNINYNMTKLPKRVWVSLLIILFGYLTAFVFDITVLKEIMFTTVGVLCISFVIWLFRIN